MQALSLPFGLEEPELPAKTTPKPKKTPARKVPGGLLADSGRGGVVYVSLTAGELLRKNLWSLMREKGFATDEKFAHECNIPKSTLSQIKNLTRSPRLDTLESLAQALEVPLSVFFALPDPLPKDWDAL